MWAYTRQGKFHAAQHALVDRTTGGSPIDGGRHARERTCEREHNDEKSNADNFVLDCRDAHIRRHRQQSSAHSMGQHGRRIAA